MFSLTWWDTLRTLLMSLNRRFNPHQPEWSFAEKPSLNSIFRTWVSKTLPTWQVLLSLATTCAPLPTLRTMRQMTKNQPNRNTWATSRSSRCWLNRRQKSRTSIIDRTVRSKAWVTTNHISRCLWIRSLIILIQKQATLTNCMMEALRAYLKSVEV